MHRNLLIWITLVIVCVLSSFASAWYEPVHYWKFDSDLTDSGRGYINNVEAVNGVPTFDGGKINNGVNLTGTEYLRNLSFKNGSIIRTIEMWVNTPTLGDQDYMFSIYNDTDNFVRMAMADSGKSIFRIKIFEEYTGVDNFSANTWYHYVLTMGTGGILLYQNGNQILGNAATNTIHSSWDILEIGNLFANAGVYSFDGIIDNVAMFEERYSADNVTAAYNSGVGMDYQPIPVINNVTVISTGDNVIHNFTANVTDKYGTIDTVLIQLETPSSVKTNYTMSALSGDLFNLTNFQIHETGNWTYTVFANNTDGYSDNANGTFEGVTNVINITEIYLVSPDPDQKLYPPLVTGNTTDTTPTFNLTTNTATAECYLGADNSTWTICSTTNATGHICTQPDALNYYPPVEDEYFKCENIYDEIDYMAVPLNIILYPNVTLNAPTNNTETYYYIHKVNGMAFNFSVEIGSYPIDECSLYGNFSGSWLINQTNTSVVTNNTIFNFDNIILPAGTYIWNVVCIDDTDKTLIWSDANYTFKIINIPPSWNGTISTERNISDYCLPTQINATFYDSDNDSLTVYFEDNHTGAYTNYTGVWINSEGIATYNINYSSHGVVDLFNWSIYVCDNEACNQTASYNFSITQNVTTLILYLNGVSADRKYELESISNLSGIINTCTGTQVWMDIDDLNYGVNYTNGNDSVVYSAYTRDTIIKNEFNDSSTGKTINLFKNDLVNYTWITIPGKTAVDTAKLKLKGVAKDGIYPKNVVVDVFNNSNIDVILPGELMGNYLYKDYFSNNKIAENLTWGIPGAIVRYINVTTNNVKHNLLNISMNLQGFSTDPKGLYFQENLSNKDSLFSATAQIPWIYDDFSQGEISDRWDQDDGGRGTSWANPYTVSLNNYIYSNSAISVHGDGLICNGPGYWSESAWNKFWDEEIDLDNYHDTNFKVYIIASASGSGYGGFDGGGGIASCSTGIKNINLNQYLGGGPAVSVTQYGGWGSGDSETKAGTFNVEIRTEGVYFDIYVDDAFYNRIGPVNKSRDQFGYYMTCSVSANCDPCASASANVAGYIYPINISGMKAKSSTMVGYSDSSTVWLDLLNTSTNLTKAKVDIDFVKPANTNYFIELSSNNGTTWESTTDETWHYFIANDNDLAVRVNLTTADSAISTTILDMVVEVVPGYGQGFVIDVGYDGDAEWNYSGVINATNPMNISFVPIHINEYIFTNCEDDLTCLVPISFKSDTVGALEVSNMNYTQNLSYILLNDTDIENNLSAYVTPQDIMIYFTSTQNGTLNLTDLYFELKGDKNITISSKFYETINYTAANDTQVFQWRYSPINTNWPYGISEYNVYPSTVNSKEVEPWGQNILQNESVSTAMWNISTAAQTDPVKIYRWYDVEVDSCLTSYSCMYYNLSNCTTISNDTNTLIISNLHNTSTGSYQKFYDFWNLTACDPNNLYLPGNFTFKGVCQDCVRTWD